MEENIKEFEKLNIRENDILEKQRIDVSIRPLKDNIQHEVHLWEPDSLEKAFTLEKKSGKQNYGNKEVYLSQL